MWTEPCRFISQLSRLAGERVISVIVTTFQFRCSLIILRIVHQGKHLKSYNIFWRVPPTNIHSSSQEQCHSPASLNQKPENSLGLWEFPLFCCYAEIFKLASSTEVVKSVVWIILNISQNEICNVWLNLPRTLKELWKALGFIVHKSLQNQI